MVLMEEEKTMAEWYVKDLSQLTHISVQTLHHYDRIGLLKPSVRLPNGYRLYSEKDLLKLQQIIALKFFGFSLAEIKKLLETNANMIDHFAVQSTFLEEKAKQLLSASRVLQKIISDCSHDKSIPWQTIIQLIEVYHMTQQLEKTWVGKALSQEELKDYAHFTKDLEKRFSPSEKKAFEEKWADLAKTIHANLDKNPESEIGIQLGKRCMEWVNAIYTKEHFSLRKSIWDKGFKGGLGGEEHGLTKECVEWLDKAITAYQMHRAITILDRVGIDSDSEVLNRWNALLEEICGDEDALKKDALNTVLNLERVSSKAKLWLKKMK